MKTMKQLKREARVAEPTRTGMFEMTDEWFVLSEILKERGFHALEAHDWLASRGVRIAVWAKRKPRA